MLYTNSTTHDIELLSGSLRIVDDSATEIAQRIQARLLTVKEEWFLDTEFGLDYRGMLWDKQTPSQVRDAHIQRQALLSAGRGSKIRSYSSEFDGVTRTLSVTMDVQLPDGTIVSASI